MYKHLLIVIIFGCLTHILMKKSIGKINIYYILGLFCVIVQMTALSKIYSYNYSMGVITTIYFVFIVLLLSLFDFIIFRKELTVSVIVGFLISFISVYLMIQ